MINTAAVTLTLASLLSRSIAAGTCGSSTGSPLINQVCPWPYSGPYQIDTSNGPRGTMQGYNQCNATTQNQNSMCVNAVANNASDWCLFGPPALATIADDEGETVAYCTRTGYGTRLIPGGAIKGLQVVRTPGYIAFGGFMDQTLINITAGDAGGELDPHGADGRGNPIGSLFYSSAFTGSIQQIIEWHMFVGSNQFCFKLCDPSYNNPSGNLCLNIYDTIGCTGNVPLNYNAINGTFSYCQGDNQQVPNGQPLPIPATSSCVTYASTALFTNTALPTSSSSSSSSSITSSTTTSGTTSGITTAPSTSGTLTITTGTGKSFGHRSIDTSSSNWLISISLLTISFCLGSMKMFI